MSDNDILICVECGEEPCTYECHDRLPPLVCEVVMIPVSREPGADIIVQHRGKSVRVRTVGHRADPASDPIIGADTGRVIHYDRPIKDIADDALAYLCQAGVLNHTSEAPDADYIYGRLISGGAHHRLRAEIKRQLHEEAEVMSQPTITLDGGDGEETTIEA